MFCCMNQARFERVESERDGSGDFGAEIGALGMGHLMRVVTVRMVQNLRRVCFSCVILK